MWTEVVNPFSIIRATFLRVWGPGGGGVWHKASVFGCLPLAAPIGLSPLLILTLCGSERVLVVSTEPLDDLSCLTTPGSAVPETGCWGGGGGGKRALEGGFVTPPPLCWFGPWQAGKALFARVLGIRNQSSPVLRLFHSSVW